MFFSLEDCLTYLFDIERTAHFPLNKHVEFQNHVTALPATAQRNKSSFFYDFACSSLVVVAVVRGDDDYGVVSGSGDCVIVFFLITCFRCDGGNAVIQVTV
jgi:hypothetical protein